MLPNAGNRALLVALDQWASQRIDPPPSQVPLRANGTLVPPRDAHALARAIVGMLNDDATRGRMGAAGYERVSEHFTVERMVSETAAVYARVARTGHAMDTVSLPDRG